MFYLKSLADREDKWQWKREIRKNKKKREEVNPFSTLTDTTKDFSGIFLLEALL